MAQMRYRRDTGGFLKTTREDMDNEFDYKGHHYKVVQIERSTDHIIIRDGRKTRRVKEEIAQKAIEYVERLFE